MKTISRLILSLVLTTALALCLCTPAYAVWELVKAFAFGADDWTRSTYNVPTVQYIKVAQDTGLNWDYSEAQGHGYTDDAALDTSSNNRGFYTGDDEIYDQFVGVKKDAGAVPMTFRIDVEPGSYRFVAAGSDADNYNHSTTIRARDGDSGAAITLVDNFEPTADGQFWRCEFDDKVVPPASADPPTFPDDARIECPTLGVTGDYIIIEQDNVGANNSGGDLCLIEVWMFKGATAGPDQTVTAGQTVTLLGGGPDDATSFSWVQVIKGDEPTVTLADPSSAQTTFNSPTREIGYILTFQLTVVSPSEGTSTDECIVTCRAPNEPRIAPSNIRLLIGHLAYRLEWDPLVDADEYGVGVKISEGMYFWFWTASPEPSHNLTNLSEGQATMVAIKARNTYGDGVRSEDIPLVPMRNAALPGGTTPPSAYVSLSGAAVPVMNDKIYDADADSSDGQFKTEDYWGYLWSQPILFDQLVYYTGQFSSNGGWFTSLTVEYTEDGTTWKEAPGVTISPPYDFTNQRTGRSNFSRYDISFWPLRGVGIRIFGTPGGSVTETFTSIAELEVYGDTSRGPLVVYGVDGTFDERSEASLDGSYAFSSRGPLSGFGWVQTGGPTVDIIDPNEAVARFSAPGVEADTVLTFEFTAGDGTESDTDEVTITIRNLVTTAVAGADQTVYEGTVVTLNGTGSVTTSGTLTYSWTQTDGPEVILTGADTATPSFTAPAIWDYHGNLLFWLEVDDGVGGLSTDSVTVTVKNPMEGDIPYEPWGLSALDLSGTVSNPNNFVGSSTYDPDTQTYTVSADGTDVWGNDDGCRFVYKEVGADFTSISVRIDPPPASWPNGWTKVGVMVRQDLDANSAFMNVLASRDNGMVQQYRTTKGGSAARQGGDPAKQPYEDGSLNFLGPVWIRLERQGDLWVGYYSYDGLGWVVGTVWNYPTQHTIPFSAPFYAGIFITSHTGTAMGTAVYGDLMFNDEPPFVLTDAYALRTLPASYQAGGTTDVSLSVRINPYDPPGTVTVTESIPTGLTVVPGSITQGGSIVGNTVRWSLTAGGVTDVAYSLQVPGDASGALDFAGTVSFPGTTVDIYGDEVVYEMPTAPQNLGVEILLGGHLIWSGTGQEGIFGYRVYRSVNGGPFMELASTRDRFYVDPTLQAGNTYNYRVTAVNLHGAEGPPSQATGEKMITMLVREAEDFNYGGGLYPGYRECPAAVEATAADDFAVGNDFWYLNDIPVGDYRRNYRPNDNVGMHGYPTGDPGEPDSDPVVIGWNSVGNWWRYSFEVPAPGPGDPPGGWVKIELKLSSNGTLELYWDEVFVGIVEYATGDYHVYNVFTMEEQFQTTAGKHTLRVRFASGGLNFDKIGIGFNWSPPKRQVIFEDDFEDYTTLYVPDDAVAAGWIVENGSGYPNARWRLWNTDPDTTDWLGNESPDIAGVTNNYMISDSDLAPDAVMNEGLLTPELDCTNWLRLRLTFSKNFRIYLEDTTNLQVGEVDIRTYDEGTSSWGGWINLLRWDSTTVSDINSNPELVDLSAYDEKKLQIRWHFHQASYDYWFAVDDIVLTGEMKEIPSGQVLSLGLVEGKVELTWEVFGGGNYTVEYASDLTTGNWQPVPGFTWPISETTWPGQDIGTLPTRYYRVRSE